MPKNILLKMISAISKNKSLAISPSGLDGGVLVFRAEFLLSETSLKIQIKTA